MATHLVVLLLLVLLVVRATLVKMPKASSFHIGSG